MVNNNENARVFCSENVFDWNLFGKNSSSSDDSADGFNYDSKYLIEVKGLPRTATRQDISDFFNNMSILNGLYGIHFLFDIDIQESGRAYVQLENLKDFQTALKQQKCMDNCHIEGNISIA